MAYFGKHFNEIMARPGESKIPRVVKLLLSWLNKHATGLEGLFRVSAGVKELNNLKAQFDSGDNISLDNSDPHLVAGLIKAYLIELPEPLLTFELYDEFIAAADASDSIAKLRETCQKLPECNKLVAGCLFLFLNNVAHHSEANRMSTNNLAIVFGQIVIRPKVESLESLLRHSPKINIILKTMIENYHAIIPGDKTEEKLIEQLLGGSDSKGDASKSDVSRAEPSNLSPEQQKLRNIKVTVEEAIQIVLERLDAMSAELENTTSLEETIEIAKRIRTAKRILFTNPQAGAAS